MNIYSRRILPRLLDWSMSGQAMATHRRQLLADVSGEVLEIGFGTGLNLAYYPEAVSQLTVVEPNPGMTAIARQRISQSEISVDTQWVSGEALPMGDRSFDSVVSTWTLCSIANVEQALSEIRRVLKPDGRFFFIEHGLSPEPGVQIWQNRLTPIQKVIADGCHINRPINILIGQQFELLNLDRFYESSLPKVAGYFYKGVARPN